VRDGSPYLHLRERALTRGGRETSNQTASKGTNGLKRDALLTVDAVLKAADPRLLVRRSLGLDRGKLRAGTFEHDLREYDKTVVVGGGKASGYMAAEVEHILGKWLAGGVVVVPDYLRQLPGLRRIEFARSTHPLPSEKGAKAVGRLLSLLGEVGRGDLVVALISGGGSALMPSPPPGVTVEQLRTTTELLLKAGAEIRETNCVRKHLSQIAGGRLVERANGADVLTLVISDVVGDDLSSIASGPTVPDPTTFADALGILESKRVWKEVPAPVRKLLGAGAAGRLKETPKPEDPIFRNATNVIVGSNSVACAAARFFLEKSGYHTVPVRPMAGEARVVGRRLGRRARSLAKHGRWAAVWGGETTVTVKGSGVGGRNQELALAASFELGASEGVALASFGTDGVDGPTDAAGAYADATTLERAKALGLEPRHSLDENDSYTFFKALGDLIVTGPTGTNVNDVAIALGRG
jgi:glycerate 2-kinase